jgi:hypothetical protein
MQAIMLQLPWSQISPAGRSLEEAKAPVHQY